MMRIIRRARGNDAESIQNLYSQLNTLSVPSVSAERISALENSDHTYLLVCVDDEDVIGSALVCFCDDVMFQDQPFAVVENVIVSADYLREGIGKSMMDHIEDLCLQRNCSKIILQTSSENRNARDFYTAMGYDPDAKIGFIKYRRYFGQ
jgi:ribosomal protein S18 acetylase RimI-like enzyme